MSEKKHAILYVDDEKDNLSVFTASFRRNYDIFTAQSGKEAIEILKSEPEIKVLLTDQRMPEMTGLELLSITNESNPGIKKIILTGFTDIKVIIEAVNKGNVYRFLTKPWDKEEVKITIDNAIHLFNIEAENKNLIKELKVANNKLEQYNESLEQEVSSRTQTLLDTIAVRDKFLNIIAHDIKQPVVSLQGFIQLLTTKYDMYDDEKRKKIIGILGESSDSLYLLIEDLLNWTKSKLDKIEFDPAYFDLNDIIHQTIEQLTPNLLDKKISIKSNLSKGLITYADSEMVKIVIRNLLSNAIKFSHPGEPVFINYELKEDSIICSIEDSGLGIPKSSIDSLFDSSKIITTRGTNGEKGTGLGLSLCFDFVQKNNGNLWIESEESKGTKVFFSLPLKK